MGGEDRNRTTFPRINDNIQQSSANIIVIKVESISSKIRDGVGFLFSPLLFSTVLQVLAGGRWSKKAKGK